jgi:RNA polymerase sigma-70 factor, ECF subfamily
MATTNRCNTTSAINEPAKLFETHRPRLFAIACRMLGTRCEAEDLVQDAYLRWHQAAGREIESPLAFLVTITKRLCLDRLRELKHEPIEYVDSSLSEAIVEDGGPSPEAQLASTQELSAGFRIVLERLTPSERVAFLLHDVFDYDHGEVARILSKSEQSCRQALHRARNALRDSRARFGVAPESGDHQRVLGKFLTAVGTGNRDAIAALLAEIGVARHAAFGAEFRAAA